MTPRRVPVGYTGSTAPDVARVLERREYAFANLVSRVVPCADAPRAFKEWSAAPAMFAKILIDPEDARWCGRGRCSR